MKAQAKLVKITPAIKPDKEEAKIVPILYLKVLFSSEMKSRSILSIFLKIIVYILKSTG
jgi:predicted membrane-bound dolichyl-phosphate-mannose-protein mannosyltransferase